MKESEYINQNIRLSGIRILSNAFEKSMVHLEAVFDKPGYVVAQIDCVAEFSDRIEHFVPVMDKKGGGVLGGGV